MSGSSDRDANPDYWEVRSNLQHAKHGILGEYIKRWLPIMSSWAGTLCYVETHAGKGVHDTGEPGSPVVVLRAAMQHTRLDEILDHSSLRFAFIERDRGNLQTLEGQLALLGPFPDRMTLNYYPGDWEIRLPEALRDAAQIAGGQPPALLFVDPYSWGVSYPLLRQVMHTRGTEVLVLIIWRELDMAVARARADRAAAATLDSMFPDGDWSTLSALQDVRERVWAGVELVRQAVGATWATPALMLGENRAVRSILLHLTNSPRGRDEMKAAMRKVCPSHDGDFIARRSDDPRQGRLFPDELASYHVESWVLTLLGQGPRRWQELLQLARSEKWLRTDINSTVRDLCRRRVVEPSDYVGRLSAEANPLLTLSDST